MPLETTALEQNAVFWRSDGLDTFGNHRVHAPVDIPVRWETGKRETVEATVNSVVVTDRVEVERTIPLGSILWKGHIVDLPSPLNELRSVVDYQEIPDIKGREVKRIVMLTNYHGELPNAT